MFRKLRPNTIPERAFIQSGPESGVEAFASQRLSLPTAFLVYGLFAFAVYFPVLFGYRFFWEDFFIQGYPVRDFGYYSLALKHHLPFWNPYSWAWAPFMADAQTGFWYPANLLQILVAKALVPNAFNLPVLAPELSVILHMVLAAAGTFQLARKKFAVPDIAAFIAGLCFGFGLRMAAEQNHEMQIYQLSLLPWEMLLLMNSWNGWGAAIGFGMLFGVSFLAGQPQTFFFIALFATGLTVSELLARRRSGDRSLMPLYRLVVGGVLSAAVAAIQLLPSLELTGISARARITYRDANSASLTFGHLLSFFVPRIDGENVGFTRPLGGMTNDWYWHWESIFYWGCLAELLAIFAVVRLWKDRRSSSPWTRHLTYFVGFSVFAIAFGLGNHLGFNWIFWRFVPIFNQLRGPNRMVWFVWFVGSIYTAIGLTYLVRNLETERSQRFLIRGALLFVVMNLLAGSGLLDLLANHGRIRDGIFVFTLPSILSSLSALGLIALLRRSLVGASRFILLSLCLIGIELWFFDFTWHRNEIRPPVTIGELQHVPQSDHHPAAIEEFVKHHGMDRSKLLIFELDTHHRYTNMGMHLRQPIEYANDTTALTGINPMRLSRAFPPAKDSNARMSIMGVSMQLPVGGEPSSARDPLPFLTLYHDYRVAQSDTVATHFYADTSMDFHKTVILENAPHFAPDTAAAGDIVELIAWSENELTIKVRSNAAGILVVNDLYFPAWRGYVDGRPASIVRAFTSLRSVEVPAGTHTVRMSYESRSFATGKTITLITLTLSAIALTVLTITGRKRRLADSYAASASP